MKAMQTQWTMVRWIWLVGCSMVLGFAAPSPADAQSVDLSSAIVVIPEASTPRHRKAVQMLREEVKVRTRLSLDLQTDWPRDASKPRIVVGTRALVRSAFPGSAEWINAVPQIGNEGYLVRWVQGDGAPTIWVLGQDDRGVLFGVGRLLRALELDRDAIRLPTPLDEVSAPKTPLRGHQLGYRPKTNSYDAWTLAMWEQYYRDLAVFGTNAVELIPPRSDDASESPHFPEPPLKMMIDMSRVADEYGLDVWLWYPALDPDYADPKTVEFALEEWANVFRQLPRVDDVLVPGGDPGKTHPKILMPFLEKQAKNLRKYHPKARIWLSPQGFNAEWMDTFLEILRGEPDWLAGLVYGPQVRMPLAEFRKVVPSKYPIRHYPDITHSMKCQYPAIEWDPAFPLTQAREVINPRPLDQARIFRVLNPYTVGFITYSEGCNDDVNKFVWSGLGWDPDGDVLEILRQYSRYFIGPKYTDDFAQGLLGLERDWRGPLAANAHINVTLAQFQEMDRAAAPSTRLNWRFQQALYRAYYDAFLRERALYERELENLAIGALRRAPNVGSLQAIEAAEEILDRAVTRPVAGDLRARVFELAEALYQSIRMQHSVARYQAISSDRGGNLDTIDTPLNSDRWLREEFGRVRVLSNEAQRLAELHRVANWTDPGPGGFYDDLGKVDRQPHLVRGTGFHDDPALFTTAMMFVENYLPKGPTSWWDQAMTLYDHPLQLRYEGLDPKSAYTARIVYGSGCAMWADDVPIHEFMDNRYQVLEFEIPPAATADGVLTLTWKKLPGMGGNGRGNQVSEVWLVKKRSN